MVNKGWFINSDWKWPVFLFYYYFNEEGGDPSCGLKISCKNLKEPFSFSYLNCVVYLSLWPLLIQKPLLYLLLIFFELFMFLEKAGLFTKFVDTFFLFVGERASWSIMQKSCDRINWMRELSDTAVFSGKKRVFLLKLNYFCLQVLFVIYL